MGVGRQVLGGKGLGQKLSDRIPARVERLRPGQGPALGLSASQGGALRVEQPRILHSPAAKGHRAACRRTKPACLTADRRKLTIFIFSR